MADVRRFERKPLSPKTATRRMRTLLTGGSVRSTPLAERQKVSGGWIDAQVFQLLVTGNVTGAVQAVDGPIYFVGAGAHTPSDGPQKARVRFEGKTLLIWALA